MRIPWNPNICILKKSPGDSDVNLWIGATVLSTYSEIVTHEKLSMISTSQEKDTDMPITTDHTRLRERHEEREGASEYKAQAKVFGFFQKRLTIGIK